MKKRIFVFALATTAQTVAQPAVQKQAAPAATDATAQCCAVEPSSCFPVESLAPRHQAAAEALFLKILDSEALYTLAGGIKPASSGFVRFVLDAESESLAAVDHTRRLLESFRCGDHVLATVHHFRRLYRNPKTGRTERHYEGIVVATGRLREFVQRHIAEFARLGVSPYSHPLEVLMAIEYANERERWRGYGRIFGFPAAAVDFFVEAGMRQKATGEFVNRRFVSLPTFARSERGVVYAVAENAEETEDDRRLRQAVEAALAEYRRRRQDYIGPQKPGAARLLRDWFCTNGKCSLPPQPAPQSPGSRN